MGDHQRILIVVCFFAFFFFLAVETFRSISLSNFILILAGLFFKWYLGDRAHLEFPVESRRFRARLFNQHTEIVCTMSKHLFM